MNKIHYLYCLLVFTIILSSCHSRKLAMKGHPGDIVQPDGSIADKYATILGVDKSNIQNGRLYAFVEQWMGTPYKFGGEDKDGVDCSGLAQLLEQQVYGINIPRSTSQQITVIKRKYEEELQEGDLLFFDYDGKKFSHVAVYLQNGYYVHASSSKGVIITKLHDPYTYKYFSRCGSIVIDTTTAQAGDSGSR
ncbi:C40 family peptidase [Mucilaginibacter xinganensis]|uniref:Glycoside hydrolase n=1 Tax=Mucilaginibacter xinganensis TaxID=1234841 RepID=A0A223NX51_9SPHI|nr:C40 family peptidase [Mucilaginibacter xinganensis]ASU34453.1 glycoside hydrolase [Mucilaginibacter xinganensis]